MKPKKITFGILVLVFLEIFMLINTSFADSFIIKKQAGIKENTFEEKNDLLVGILNSGLNLLIGFFEIKQIGIVSASEVCCEKLESGGWCLNSEDTNCDSAYASSGTLCSSTSYCKTGWCFDPKNGFCSVGSPKARCENGGGEWSLDFNADKCTPGCCVLGANTQYVEKKRCEILSGFYGIETEFDATLSEAECRFYSDEEGACILSNNECKRTTEKTCHDSYKGTFYIGRLCSNPNLNTSCIRQTSVSCSEGKDEIYWYDSCKNRENIYDSNKERSWNNGKILPKEQSCNPTSANINDRNCGNCGYNFESICKQTAQTQTHIIDGNYICSSKNCGERKNGESWCEYDSYVGNLSAKLERPAGSIGGILGEAKRALEGEIYTQSGSDLPGTNHFLKYCEDGEIKTQMCGEAGYREKICAQKNVNGISRAECRVNFASFCFAQTNKQECDSIPDCVWQSVDLTGQNEKDNFKFSACVAKYPKGFDLSSTNSFQRGSELCSSMGDNGKVTCTIIEQKGWDFAWGCKVNCGCDSKEFVKQMNDFCSSLGDCGVSINLAGKVSGDLPLGGKFKRPTTSDWLNKYKGLLIKNNVIGDNTPLFISFSENTESYSDSITGEIESPETPGSFEAIYGGNIGGALGIFLTGGGIALGLYYSVGLLFWGVVGGVIGLLILPVLGSLFGIGKTREKTTTFSCRPWIPPVGGADCDLCNRDPDKPCTEYRCEALGTSCRLETNVYDSEKPVCVNAFSQDSSAPVLSFEKVDPGIFTVSGNKIMIKPLSEACYTEYLDKIDLTINTDEYSICKWDKTDRQSFDEMENYFREENAWSESHIVEELSVNGDRLILYIKCQDRAGNYNLQSMSVEVCIKDAPDTLSAIIEKTSPETGSYIPLAVNQTLFTVYLNEPAQCMFDYSPNTLFENMANYMSCNIEDYESFEWSCRAMLENITQNSTSVYIKCNDSSGNINPQDYEYTIYKTQDPLEIISSFPANNSIIERPVTSSDPLYMEVSTSGGIENGKSVCSFKFIENGWRDFFTQTDSEEHRYMFTSLPSQNYSVEIFCTDKIGNTALEIIHFSLEVDSEAPKIIRALHDGAYLKLITDEDALCYYGSISCNFDIDDATKFTDGSLFKNTHSDYWDSDKTYYLKCKDEYNNQNTDCALIVRPSTV